VLQMASLTGTVALGERDGKRVRRGGGRPRSSVKGRKVSLGLRCAG
jgi:hypothetical protein